MSYRWTFNPELGCYVVENLPLNCDGDGANGQTSLPCYGPAGSGIQTLDYLANAGSPGNWYGIYTVGGRPMVQTSGMPSPGAFISTTSYQILKRADGSEIPEGYPERYLDAASVPFIVVPESFVRAVPGIVKGCRGEVEYKGKVVSAMGGGDTGPAFGEFSLAVCREFDPLASPKSTNISAGVTVRLWPGEQWNEAYPLQAS